MKINLMTYLQYWINQYLILNKYYNIKYILDEDILYEGTLIKGTKIKNGKGIENKIKKNFTDFRWLFKWKREKIIWRW